MNLSRIFAYAIVRRIAYVLVVLLFAWVGIGKAHAQSCPPTTDARVTAAGISGQYATSDEALAACNSTGSPGISIPQVGWHDRFTTGSCTVEALEKKIKLIWVHDSVWSSCVDEFSGADSSKDTAVLGWSFLEETTCSNKPPDGPVSYDDPFQSGSYCKDGCEYVPTIGVGSSGNYFNVGGVAFANGATTNGNSCTTGTPLGPYNPNNNICTSTGGGYHECVKSDGTHCVTRESDGKQLCWAPSEESKKITADGNLAGNRAKDPTQPQPPSEQENPQVETNSSVNINGDVYNTVVSTGTGITGPTQPDTGVPGDGNNDGTGGGTNDGEGEGEDDGVGDVAGDGEALYQGNGRTVGDVFSDFKIRIEAAPIAVAGTEFLTTTVSAACPVFSVEATDYWDTLTFDYHCSGPLADALGYGAFIILAIAAFAAFKVAFY